ncbi:MAG TPA: hypothetical protein VFE62_27585, partial [Gemmataceae bacterium]|nr:hypothetical protein [Gemmataceae bacterium]
MPKGYSMRVRAVQHISVWLDDQSAGESDFAHALTWALGLNLSLRVVASGFSNRNAIAERLHAWSAVCIRKGVALETHLASEANLAARQQFLRPGGICVLGDLQRDLFADACTSPAVCQLIGVPDSPSLNRLLILCHQATIHASYLETAAGICQALDRVPTVLILGRTERDAQIKQGYVAGLCNALRLEADFDLAVDG